VDPLVPITWRVSLNGTEAFDLDVPSPEGIPPYTDVCFTVPDADPCGTVLDPTPFEVGRVCHADSANTGTRVPIRVYEACGGCDPLGPCQVSLSDTNVLVVRATRNPTSCDVVCPPVCIAHEHVCYTPALDPGSYRVVVEGLPTDESTYLEVSDGGDMPGETCLGG
jgi:hypothetical protein